MSSPEIPTPSVQKDDVDTQLASIIVPNGRGDQALRDAAALFVDNGLRRGESVFVPGRAIWTSTNVAELMARFVGRPDVEGDDFIDKLAIQLDGASDDVKLLMAELVTWQLLPIWRRTIGETRKRKRIEAVLGLMEHPVTIPEVVLAALPTGAFNPGRWMGGQLFGAMSIIIHTLNLWVGLASERKLALLDDPLLLRDFIRDEVQGPSSPTQRNALLYLIRPDYFQSIVAVDQKLAIRDAFVGEVGGEQGDIDVDLNRITRALQVKAGRAVDFYDDTYARVWRRGDETDTADAMADSELPLDKATFPAATEELAARVFIGIDWLDRTLAVLRRRKQIIFYGPPGTGKTYLARALADHIAGGDGGVRLVQFHPSYSYEDFFEGLRPATQDGALVYTLQAGPMKRIADEAAKNPELNYVLVIDEINRGNLAKIFGELYFLLEYRDERVSLLYEPDTTFTLPANVYIIGTMNTSDRSIALMDAAMRRRFAFLELHPGEAPVAQVLPAWLDANDLPAEIGELFALLNERIDDREFRVGPSYLMASDRDLGSARLQEIWTYELLPLLAEHHYGDGTDIAGRYGLEALRAELQKRTA
ncbi:AAA family ATPase [Leifsonia sp. NPDC080035]|uniref:AAA family ATPase n=1 Tax=Leifsonia sp. NPDC080035 TaxID=3143936 RepID=A0AAU7GB90_9MICO